MSLEKIKQPLPPFDKKSTHHCDFLRYCWAARVIFSSAGRECYIVIRINPTFTKMIDQTEKPKIPSKFAKLDYEHPLFSVVRRAKRDIRKWPRALLMARGGRVVSFFFSCCRPRFARSLLSLNLKKKRHCSQSIAKYAGRYNEFGCNFQTPPIHTSAKIPLVSPSFKAPLH